MKSMFNALTKKSIKLSEIKKDHVHPITGKKIEVVNEKPPMYDNMSAAFKITAMTIFTYGNKIYNPFDVAISPDLLVHESGF